MSDIIRQIYNQIADVKEAIVINVNNDTPKAWDSKVGGVPYILEDDDYPVSSETGRVFDFLIQINCFDLPNNEFFPKSGLLQFFINKDYTYDEDDLPFYIKYIANVDRDEAKIDYDLEDDFDRDNDEEDEEDDYIVDEDDNMIDEELKISFTKKDDHINSTSKEWNDLKKKLAIALYPYRDELEDYESLVEEDVYVDDLDFILEDEDNLEVKQANKMLGYPDNFGEDIRLSDSKYQDYILLLQLHPDSDFFVNVDESSICWFIHPDDLKNLNFNNVICSYFENETSF